MVDCSHFKIRLASQALHQGKLLAYPTEAVYGLGCDPLNEQAVMKLLNIKQRPVHKGLILVASDFSQLLPFVAPNPEMINRIIPTWPGPFTWVLPAQPWVPFYLTGRYNSLAIRVSSHPTIQRLCTYYGGAIVSTSANISNQPPARSALAVRKNLPSKTLLILSGDTALLNRPTPIYSAQTGLCLRL